MRRDPKTSTPPPACALASPAHAMKIHPLTWAGLVLATLAVLGVYLSTAAPGAWWGDGQELACAAWTLGIPHPTGYPLYTLLGHVWMKLLGFMDPGHALTLMSTALMSASFGLLALALWRLMAGQAGQSENAPAQPGCPCGFRVLVGALGVALLVAVARTPWEHATFTEVYPLTYALGLAVLVMTLTPLETARRPLARGAALGLLMGVLALNHYSGAALAPLAGLYLLRGWVRLNDAAQQTGKRKRPRPRAAGVALLWLPVALGCACLLGYLYLYVRAKTNPALNWGDPSTLERLAWVLRGGQFSQLKAGAGDPLAGLMRWAAWWGGQWLPARLQTPALSIPAGLILIAAAAAGLVRLAARRWDLGWGLLAALVMTAGFGAFYMIPDIDAYFMLALPAAAVGWTEAVRGMLARARQKDPAFMRRGFFHALPALAALAVLVSNRPLIDISADDAPQRWSQTVLAALPPGALIVTQGDNDIYSLWYRQMVQSERPDVSVLGSQFIFSGWYARYFEYPGRPQIPTRIEERPPRDKLTFDAALIGGTLLPNLNAGRRVFVTYRDPVLENFFAPRPLLAEPIFTERDYRLTRYPYGLPGPMLYELTPDPSLTKLSEPELHAVLTEWYRGQTGSQR